jgi:glucuronate isomerase
LSQTQIHETLLVLGLLVSEYGRIWLKLVDFALKNKRQIFVCCGGVCSDHAVRWRDIKSANSRSAQFTAGIATRCCMGDKESDEGEGDEGETTPSIKVCKGKDGVACDSHVTWRVGSTTIKRVAIISAVEPVSSK